MRNVAGAICAAAVLGALASGCAAGPAEPGASDQAVEVQVGDHALFAYAAEDRKLLLRHLAGSARWRVTDIRGAAIAFRREPADELSAQPGALRASRDGFAFRHQPWRRFRVMLGLDPPAALAGSFPDEWSPILTRAGEDARTVSLRVAPGPPPDLRSALLLSGDGLSLDVREESMDPGRETTRRLLRETGEELDEVLEREEELAAGGYLPGLAPGTSVAAGLPFVRLERGREEGRYQLVGRVNPGRPGRVHARVVHLHAGGPIDAERLRMESTEYVGWSADRRRLFFFNSELEIPLQAPAPVRIEIWFVPEGEEAGRKLIEGSGKIG